MLSLGVSKCNLKIGPLLRPTFYIHLLLSKRLFGDVIHVKDSEVWVGRYIPIQEVSLSLGCTVTVLTGAAALPPELRTLQVGSVTR